MKRRLLLCILLSVLCLFAVPVSAKILCDCGKKNCICFIQYGDEGIAVRAIVELLDEQGYLSSRRGDSFDDVVYEAVCLFQEKNHLAVTGVMDDDTLSMLIWGRDEQSLSTVHPELEMETVWVPTDGGKKRHRLPTCSGMYDPRKMSVCNAKALQIDACKRCKPK